MAMAIPSALVEFVLFGPEDDRRQLQDSPILGDVWMEFSRNPAASLDLLITPYGENPAGVVAFELANRLGQSEDSESPDHTHDVAYLQGVVAAKLSFEELVSAVVPMTHWWKGKAVDHGIRKYFGAPTLIATDVEELLRSAFHWFQKKSSEGRIGDSLTYKRYVVLAALFFWARDSKRRGKGDSGINDILGEDGEKIEQLARSGADALVKAFKKYDETREGSVWTISLNRRALPALTKSVAAVKADAARTLFNVDCSQIAWAVLDSGIDAGHMAFQGGPKGSRVVRTFDFTKIRQIISLDNRSEARAKQRVADLLATPGLKARDEDEQETAARNLRDLAQDAAKGRSIDWKLVEPFIEMKPDTKPVTSHGTHVAGIIGGRVPKDEPALVPQAQAVTQPSTPTPVEEEAPPPAQASAIKPFDVGNGMCPDIKLYDFRVLGPTIRETEFAIIAALQYIRYLNERNSYPTIHGANLSLSIPHDVRNYACGRTPICQECERLVNSGVVVVAAAGNRGYQNFETKEGSYEGYAAFSITDPGNCDGVITVGSTHRYWPHTYGVSFFSSRGPTGDGRMKPDLVAPGERIRAPVGGNNEWGDLDGTSMAAPHVSGAAAMLMARYSEFIGQPRRIKQILCETATDLGRERSFQGHGMLDVLRAFQKI